MRIALLTNGLARAGAEKQLVLLARQLKERGDEVLVIKMLPSDGYVAELEQSGIPVLTLELKPKMRSISALKTGTKVLRRWKPDVVIGFVYQAVMLGRLAGRLAGVPVIISSLRNERQRNRRRDLLLRLTDRLGSITTTNSTLTATALCRSGAVNGKRLVVIPNGIDISNHRFSQAARTTLRDELGINDGEFLWLAAGRLKPQKNFGWLLEAIAERLRASHLGVLVIAGSGPLQGELEYTIAYLGLGSHVKLLGFRPDLPALMSAADGFVLSSAYEGMPNVVMEALASGLPVVATRVGGVSELVINGVSGFLVPPGDGPAMMAIMTYLVNTPEHVRRQMGAKGRAHVEERYSIERSRQAWFDLIDQEVASV